MRIARICRFGNQNVFEILGTSPPLSPIDMELFDRALYEVVKAEYSSSEEKLDTSLMPEPEE